jgi:hypothetical protein
MQEGRNMAARKAMLIALMRSNIWMAFASQEVQTMTSRWPEEAQKNIPEYDGIAYSAN